jgi:hypothetical protein
MQCPRSVRGFSLTYTVRTGTGVLIRSCCAFSQRSYRPAGRERDGRKSITTLVRSMAGRSGPACTPSASSANLTEAAYLRNIEAGVLVDNPLFARDLHAQFEALVRARMMMRLPGL